MHELLRKWTLEVAEFVILKILYVYVQDYERAKEYRLKEIELQRRINEIKQVLNNETAINP